LPRRAAFRGGCDFRHAVAVPPRLIKTNAVLGDEFRNSSVG
jgi:hypothetical protein